MRLNNKLESNCLYPFHMPGHKRNNKFGIAGVELDITEIEGFDNLHNAKGVLAEVENALKSIYKSKKSFMLVNGSTVGILSAIFAVCDEGDKIIIARNCHKSVYNACMLRKLRVVYIEPAYDRDNGYYTSVSQSTVSDAFFNNKDARAVVITSPTYEGCISEIKCDIPLIIDAAHGAHFGIDVFPVYPKGDIVISSLHKTLPALTQTAVANIYNQKYIERFKRYVDIFETSSPSYVLMSSVAKCCDYIKNNKADFAAYYDMLCETRDIDLHNLRLMYSGDASKIVISTANASIDGTELAKILRQRFKIEVEMASKNYIIIMTSVGDTKEGFTALKNALIQIDKTLLSKAAESIKKPTVPKDECTISVDDDGIECDIDKCAGKASNEFVYAYPPDIPVLCPNEIITEEIIDYIRKMQCCGVNIVSDSNLLPNKLLTKAD